MRVTRRIPTVNGYVVRNIGHRNSGINDLYDDIARKLVFFPSGSITRLLRKSGFGNRTIPFHVSNDVYYRIAVHKGYGIGLHVRRRFHRLFNVRSHHINGLRRFVFYAHTRLHADNNFFAKRFYVVVVNLDFHLTPVHVNDYGNFIRIRRSRREGREHVRRNVRIRIDFLYRLAVNRDIFLQVLPSRFVNNAVANAFGKNSFAERNTRVSKFACIARAIPTVNRYIFSNIHFRYARYFLLNVVRYLVTNGRAVKVQARFYADNHGIAKRFYVVVVNLYFQVIAIPEKNNGQLILIRRSRREGGEHIGGYVRFCVNLANSLAVDGDIVLDIVVMRTDIAIQNVIAQVGRKNARAKIDKRIGKLACAARRLPTANRYVCGDILFFFCRIPTAAVEGKGSGRTHFIGHAFVDKHQPLLHFKGHRTAKRIEIVFMNIQAQSRRLAFVNQYGNFIFIICISRKLRVFPTQRAQRGIRIDFSYRSAVKQQIVLNIGKFFRIHRVVIKVRQYILIERNGEQFQFRAITPTRNRYARADIHRIFRRADGRNVLRSKVHRRPSRTRTYKRTNH